MTRRPLAAIAATVVAATVLGGCTFSPGTPDPTASKSASGAPGGSPSASASPTAQDQSSAVVGGAVRVGMGAGPGPPAVTEPAPGVDPFGPTVEPGADAVGLEEHASAIAPTPTTTMPMTTTRAASPRRSGTRKAPVLALLRCRNDAVGTPLCVVT